MTDVTISFSGPRGAGKTRLAHFVWTELLLRGFAIRETGDVTELSVVSPLSLLDAIEAQNRKSEPVVKGISYEANPEQLEKLKEIIAASMNKGILHLVPDDANPLVAYLRRQWEWSLRTFGPDFRTKSIIDHITKELREVEKDPHDLMEWLDIVIIALDGYWRHGGSPERLMAILQAKQDKNFARNWPDYREMSPDQAVEHDRSGETA